MSSALIRPVIATDHAALVALWEAAVRATHDFLGEEDIAFFRGFLPGIFGHLDVQVAELDGRVAGFIGTSARHIEALFVDPSLHRHGIGRQLLDAVLAIDPRLPWTVDVNEQNPGATRFYERYGFVRIGRSELDASGRPFPLLHLVLRR